MPQGRHKKKKKKRKSSMKEWEWPEGKRMMGGGAGLWHVEVPGQRSLNPSHSSNLSCSSDHTRSLTC